MMMMVMGMMVMRRMSVTTKVLLVLVLVNYAISLEEAAEAASPLLFVVQGRRQVRRRSEKWSDQALHSLSESSN